MQSRGDQGQAQRSFSDPEASGCDVKALGGDSRAVRQQEGVPGHGTADGADAHGEDCCVGQPVGHGQAGHRHPARWGKLERAQPLGPGPDGRSGIADGAPQQTARVPWNPCGASFERAAKLWPARGGRDPDEDRCCEHAARDRDPREQDFPGRQPCADRDEGRSRRGDHPAGQQ
jgi:hypothetical protein